jgi:hypothetical protein
LFGDGEKMDGTVSLCSSFGREPKGQISSQNILSVQFLLLLLLLYNCVSLFSLFFVENVTHTRDDRPQGGISEEPGSLYMNLLRDPFIEAFRDVEQMYTAGTMRDKNVYEGTTACVAVGTSISVIIIF